MDQQHTKIVGYRDLTQAEIDLMNKIKWHAVETEALCAEVRTHIADQAFTAKSISGEATRLIQAEPGRWASIARTDFQTGFMALVRAVAQPTTF